MDSVVCETGRAAGITTGCAVEFTSGRASSPYLRKKQTEHTHERVVQRRSRLGA